MHWRALSSGTPRTGFHVGMRGGRAELKLVMPSRNAAGGFAAGAWLLPRSAAGIAAPCLVPVHLYRDRLFLEGSKSCVALEAARWR